MDKYIVNSIDELTGGQKVRLVNLTPDLLEKGFNEGGIYEIYHASPSEDYIEAMTPKYDTWTTVKHRHIDGLQSVKDDTKEELSASAFLRAAAQHIEDRAASRDNDERGERSMARTVAMFNAARDKNLSEEDGWLFMIFLKISRSLSGEYHKDDYDDGIGYEALRAECAALANYEKTQKQ